MLKVSIVFFATLASLSAAAPTRRDTCTPDLNGGNFRVAVSSDHTQVWRMNDCIEPQCVTISVDTVVAADPFEQFVTDTSVNPFEVQLSTNPGPNGFCWSIPSWGAQYSGRECVAGEVTQEFRFDCQSCPGAAGIAGTGCRVYSFDWGQCAENDGSVIVSKECSSGSAAQTFDILYVLP